MHQSNNDVDFDYWLNHPHRIKLPAIGLRRVDQTVEVHNLWQVIQSKTQLSRHCKVEAVTFTGVLTDT